MENTASLQKQLADEMADRKSSESRFRQIRQLYSALTKCHQAIMHSSNREALFQQICHIMVEHGGMKLAWVGIVHHDTQSIEPIAGCGAALETVQRLDIRLGSPCVSDAPISGSAILMKQPIWCQDMQGEQITPMWQDIAKQSGLRSAAALPLRKNGEVIGNFSIYADEENAFDDEARKLLEEMANDVSFALDNFERETKLQLAAKIFEQSNESLFIADAARKVVMVNSAFTKMTGLSENDALGKDIRALYSGPSSQENIAAILSALDKNPHWQGEIWNYRRGGEPYLEWLSIGLTHDASGNLTHYIGIASDITQRRRDKEHMDWLSHFDPLTGLPNRTLLEDRCQQAIHLTQSTNEPLALMYLDLDHFKHINDTLGHLVGDQLLQEIATRLERLLRGQDILSRLSADEFVLAMPGMSATAAAHFAENIKAAISRPFNIEGHEVNISSSIGIAMCPIDGNHFNDLLKCADMAMSRAKLDGRNDFCFFMPEIHTHSMRVLQLENALRRAIERDQLTLHFQPQVFSDTGKIVAAEALLRWEHPEFGHISPAEFIPIAENSGLIIPVGEWVMRQAVTHIKTWMSKGLPPIIISVNISPLQFRQSGLPLLVKSILEETGLTPQYLELELTESAAMENPEVAIAIMDELHKLGVLTSIDDFGTGYSSLAHLKRFHLHKLKIDRSFVRDIANDADDRTIIRAIINMASSLGMKTIAEGVENQEQLHILKESGCDYIQGYYFSPPLTEEQFEEFLQKNAPE